MRPGMTETEKLAYAKKIGVSLRNICPTIPAGRAL